MAAISKKHEWKCLTTCDHSLLKPFQRRLEKFGIEIQATGNPRTAGWRLFQPTTGQVLPTGFDQDVQRVIDQMEAGTQNLHDVRHPGDSGKFHSRVQGDGAGPHVQSRSVSLDNTKRCLVCGSQGGLPCPSMVKAGHANGFVWFQGHTQLDLTHAHVHPGRCRKRLKAHNEAGIAARKP